MKNGLHIDENGNKRWYKDGIIHREDGPAAEFIDGIKHWALNGRFHREDGPALVRNGKEKWWFEGVYYGNKKPKNWNKLIKQLKAQHLLDE